MILKPEVRPESTDAVADDPHPHFPVCGSLPRLAPFAEVSRAPGPRATARQRGSQGAGAKRLEKTASRESARGNGR
jgi:hypothetical protein